MLKGPKGLTGFASVLSRATANIHQEKNANIQGYAFHPNNYFLSLKKNILRSLSFTWIPLLSTNPIKFQIAKYISNLFQKFDF